VRKSAHPQPRRGSGVRGPSGRVPARPTTRRVRGAAMLLTVLLGCSVLAACGSEDTGPPTLTWYINPDVGNVDPTAGGQATLAKECAEASNGAYDMQVQLLPVDASQQREQLVRRLAAQDSSIDLMSLDPPFTAEFATAGFLAPVPEEKKDLFTQGVLDGAVEQARWEGELVAVPFWANTQLLWYRKSVVREAGLDMSRPVTWGQIIDAAVETGTTVAVQANRYEGYSVWINALVEGAGGSIVENAEAGQDAAIALDSPAGHQAAAVIDRLTSSPAAPPAVSTAQETEALAAFAQPDGGFLVNWPYIYADPTTQGIRDDIGWTRYPRTVAGRPSAPPLGGINLAVSAFSEHKDLAYRAAQCITSAQHQKEYMLNAGNPAAKAVVYSDPEIRAAYPMADVIRASIDTAAPRVPTPYWSDVSSALQRAFHSPNSVDQQTPEEATRLITDVLQGRALL
jgi:multiple sugar transport system substrate-binding protein